MPGAMTICGWLTQAFTMSNGGQFYNRDIAGEVYYDQPSTRGAVQLLERPRLQVQGRCRRARPSRPGVRATSSPASASMVLLSTGSLTFIRNGAKFP